jgi:hypothetical protein
MALPLIDVDVPEVPSSTSVVRKNVHQTPEGIANIEAAYTLFLSCWPIFDGEPYRFDTPKGLIEVVNLDR